jgi:hypothetical protein
MRIVWLNFYRFKAYCHGPSPGVLSIANLFDGFRFEKTQLRALSGGQARTVIRASIIPEIDAFPGEAIVSRHMTRWSVVFCAALLTRGI